jgi:Domain of unknown function (DUF4249)
MKRWYILAILIILSHPGCKEEYNPKISTMVNSIVVEGLLTNLRESYVVKISSASAYDSTLNKTGILGAKVSIKDDEGNVYLMHEEIYLMEYYSDTNEFIAVPGKSYILHIEMPGGDVYESTAQKLTQAANIDSIYGNVTNKEYLYTNQLGQLTTKMAFGSETFLDLSYSSDSVFQFRFENTLMKCYTYWYWYTPEMKLANMPFPPANPCYGPACPYMMFGWKKFNLTPSINLTNTTHNLLSKFMKNSSICFFPFDNSFYPIMITKDSCGLDIFEKRQCITLMGPSAVEGDLLETRIYSLNQVASVYYTQANAQLSSQGKLFDPIAVQLNGNIKCINNPNKLALGLFEVSSCTIKSYLMIFNYLGGYTTYKPINDISGVPSSGTGKNFPYFWQSIFNNK